MFFFLPPLEPLTSRSRLTNTQPPASPCYSPTGKSGDTSFLAYFIFGASNMTARQTRRERRASERKAKKLARKAAQHPAIDAIAPSSGDTPAEFRFSPESEDEFSPEFLTHAASLNEHFAAPESPRAAQAQITRAQTNRANAQHSTGPRTRDGKLASSRNSLKHGLASSQLIIPGENRADFDTLLAGLLAEHQPASPTEELLVHQIAQSWWLTQRALRFQNDCFTAEGVDNKRLSLFLRYQTTHERAFHKALSVLIRLKKDRVRGFVSQPSAKRQANGGFVSQDPCTERPITKFVSKNEPPENRLERRTA
jgi:hypothetical protein